MLDDRIIVQDRTADYGLAALLQNTKLLPLLPLLNMLKLRGFGPLFKNYLYDI